MSGTGIEDKPLCQLCGEARVADRTCERCGEVVCAFCMYGDELCGECFDPDEEEMDE